MRFRFGLDHFSLLVEDIDRSVAFYRDVMGFTPIERETRSHNVWLEIGGGDAIHLIVRGQGESHVTKDTHVAVSTSDFDAFVAHLTGLGVDFEDWDGNPRRSNVHRNGFRQVYLRDPDGYWIEINDHRPPAA